MRRGRGSMDFAKAFDLHIISILLLLFVYFNTRKWTKNNLSSKLFKYVLMAMLVNTVLDFAGWYVILSEATSPTAIKFNWILNTIIYATLGVPMSFWIMYIDYKIYHDVKKLKKYRLYYFSPVIIHLVLATINIFTGVIFSINNSGEYLRGPLFYVVVMSMYLIPVWALVLVHRNRKTMSTKLIESILFFWLLPVVGAVIQLFFYGWMITWPIFVVVTVFAYMLVEKDAMLKDDLTDLDSRRVFEDKAWEMIKRKTAFSLMMIDLNDFKVVNDTYGHTVGDETLRDFSEILRKSVKASDYICRYGGDEFVIMLLSDSELTGLEVGKKICDNVDDYNNMGPRAFDIKLSYGTKYYSHYETVSLTEMVGEVDKLMYMNKVKTKILDGF